jgi:methanogenic corrinoid protein MtbC1
MIQTNEIQQREYQLEGDLADLTKQYLNNLLQSDRHAASKLIKDAVENGTSIKEIYLQVFQQSQIEIGRLWQTNQITVAQEHYCTATTQLIMSQLYPYIMNAERINKRLLAVCVGGELHEIGVRMVADFFEMAGWDTYYIGANTPIESILETLHTQKIDLIAISATITYNIPEVSKLINSIKSSDVGSNIKILVGGRPFNISQELWKKVGADGYAPDAEKAIEKAHQMILN